MNDIFREVIDNIFTIKFYNLSFRCYRGVYKNYVVGIFPFVTDIFEIINQPNKIGISGNFEYSDYNNNVIEILRFHHLEYEDKPEIYLFDPCLLYEKVVGDKIHTDPPADEHKMDLSKEFYIEQRQQFDNVINKTIRKTKLNKINRNE